MILCLQEPQRIILGQTEVFRRKKGSICQTQSNDEAHYIPLLDSLKNLLSDEFILNEVVQIISDIFVVLYESNC